MKKILSICLAAAAFVGCTSTGVEFDTPNEIGFTAVANNSTRAVVDGDVYPTGLNMYVYAWTAGQATVGYINKGLFVHRTEKVDSKDVWGGDTPYYWPNVNRLHFAGYSASGNVASATVGYDAANNKLTIAGYTPGTATAEGANDLMYFPSTAAAQTNGYLGKETKSVPVVMYHTCSWITFLVKGEGVTANSTYQVTGLTITDIDNNATVACGHCDAVADVATAVVWGGDADDNEDAKTATLPVTLASGLGVLTTDAINVETAAEYDSDTGTTGNLVVIPQVPGKLTLSYTYKSSTGATITEEVKGIDLKIDADPEVNVWEPGKHYIYTITIKANEILIAPSAGDWTDSNHNITVE